MAKHFNITDKQLVLLHWLIVGRYNIDDMKEFADKMTGDSKIFEDMQQLHIEIQCAIERPDRSGQYAHYQRIREMREGY